MNIGFDAKRAFHNSTGLGMFSRVLIQLMAQHFPEHEYYLYNPKPGNLFVPNSPNIHEIQPHSIIQKSLKSIWRSKWIVNDLKRDKIDLFHGLSHEIPVGIEGADIPSIVAMHDMFPELYPNEYNPIDVRIYRSKTRYACKHATRIMAISAETKKHIVDFYQIDPSKIDVVYQSIASNYFHPIADEQKRFIREKYQLPKEFFLHVGTIIDRKNLLNIVKAIQLIKKDIPIPLVVIGKGSSYKKRIEQYIVENKLENQVIFLSDRNENNQVDFLTQKDLPTIYHLAKCMIYPSFYEGFGIPILEAMASGTPVITSNTSCMPEVGGDAAYYVNPNSAEEMAEGLKSIYSNFNLSNQMIKDGLENVKRFTHDKYAQNIMNMYQKAIS
ncbi:MAG: glycosyltransferase family 1 protein [Bacteroidia bacterium]|nr:MAG: glycosyltransferase family 1 protein [Bacteroidia bacterium]